MKTENSQSGSRIRPAIADGVAFGEYPSIALAVSWAGLPFVMLSSEAG
ncbi:MAG: hypothetical protein PHF70_13810 [Opitutales bacterium]|nr:hypothetical protein [Opitutales bacterium]